MYQLKIKRAYDAPAGADGERILVDRLWPRGIKKESLQASRWDKEVAPSSELRKWFVHDVEKFPEFAKRYTEELNANPAAAALSEHCRQALQEHDVTLLFGAKDAEHNQAVVLREWIGHLI